MTDQDLAKYALAPWVRLLIDKVCKKAGTIIVISENEIYTALERAFHHFKVTFPLDTKTAQHIQVAASVDLLNQHANKQDSTTAHVKQLCNTIRIRAGL